MNSAIRLMIENQNIAQLDRKLQHTRQNQGVDRSVEELFVFLEIREDLDVEIKKKYVLYYLLEKYGKNFTLDYDESRTELCQFCGKQKIKYLYNFTYNQTSLQMGSICVDLMIDWFKIYGNQNQKKEEQTRRRYNLKQSDSIDRFIDHHQTE